MTWTKIAEKKLTADQQQGFCDLYWDNTFAGAENVDIQGDKGRLTLYQNESGEIKATVDLIGDNDTREGGKTRNDPTNGQIHVVHEFFYTSRYTFDERQSTQRATLEKGNRRLSSGLWQYTNEVLTPNLKSGMIKRAAAEYVRQELLPLKVLESPFPTDGSIFPLTQFKGRELRFRFTHRRPVMIFFEEGSARRREPLLSGAKLPDENNELIIKVDPFTIQQGKIIVIDQPSAINPGTIVAQYPVEVVPKIHFTDSDRKLLTSTGELLNIPLESQEPINENFQVKTYKKEGDALQETDSVLLPPIGLKEMEIPFKKDHAGEYVIAITDSEGHEVDWLGVVVAPGEKEIDSMAKSSAASADPDADAEKIRGLIDAAIAASQDQGKKWENFVKMIRFEAKRRGIDLDIEDLYEEGAKAQIMIDIRHPNAGSKPAEEDKLLPSNILDFLAWLGAHLIPDTRLAVPPSQITVASHTDIRGNKKTNQILSGAWAKLVQKTIQKGYEELSGEKLGDDKFQAEGKGSEETTAQTQTVRWKQDPNRRHTVITISVPADKTVMLGTPVAAVPPIHAAAAGISDTEKAIEAETKAKAEAEAKAQSEREAQARAKAEAEAKAKAEAEEVQPKLSRTDAGKRDRAVGILSRAAATTNSQARLGKYQEARWILAPLSDIENVADLKSQATTGIQETEAAIVAEQEAQARAKAEAKAKAAAEVEARRKAQQVRTLLGQAKDKIRAGDRAKKKEEKIARYEEALAKLDTVLGIQPDHAEADLLKEQVNQKLETLRAETPSADTVVDFNKPDAPQAPAIELTANEKLDLRRGKTGWDSYNAARQNGQDVGIQKRGLTEAKAAYDQIPPEKRKHPVEEGSTETVEARLAEIDRILGQIAQSEAAAREAAAAVVSGVGGPAADSTATPQELSAAARQHLVDGQKEFRYFEIASQPGMNTSPEEQSGYLKRARGHFEAVLAEQPDHAEAKARVATIDSKLPEVEAKVVKVAEPADGTTIEGQVGKSTEVLIRTNNDAILTAQVSAGGVIDNNVGYFAGGLNRPASKEHRFIVKPAKAGSNLVQIIHKGRVLTTVTVNAAAAADTKATTSPAPVADEWASPPPYDAKNPQERANWYQATGKCRSTIKSAFEKATESYDADGTPTRVDVVFLVNPDGSIGKITVTSQEGISSGCQIVEDRVRSMIRRWRFEPTGNAEPQQATIFWKR